MTLPPEIVGRAPDWAEEAAPCNNVIVSSRARYARNLADEPFSPHASSAIMASISEKIHRSFSARHFFDQYLFLSVGGMTATDRGFLKEARLISRELEAGGDHRGVYVASDLKSSVMVNEEDHLRLQVLEPGLQIHRVHERLEELDHEIGSQLEYAYHERLGFLTACPTNVGTALRVSVMMHLPGLTLRRTLEAALRDLPAAGLTVRGFHGENSENLGDFFQISNEVTLGRSVSDIVEVFSTRVGLILEKELEARSLLLREETAASQDSIWRSYGILAYARKIETAEAMKLLSRVRLGLDEGYFPGLTHERLNRLVLEIQPHHLMLVHGAPDESGHRDDKRAELIRTVLANAR